VLMLQHLEMPEPARRIEEALGGVIERGETVTADLGGTATTTGFTDALVSAMDRI